MDVIIAANFNRLVVLQLGEVVGRGQVLGQDVVAAGVAEAVDPFATAGNAQVIVVTGRAAAGLTNLADGQLEFVDIAGLVRGASKGEGRGNQFLDNIHHVDAIVHVVRCFQNDNVVHVDGKVDPVSDIDTINLELILSDLERCEKTVERLSKKAKGKKKSSGKK